MARSQYSDLDFLNGTRIINLPDGTLPQHPATVAQLNAAIQGLAWKDSVRAASVGNINLAAPGASVDGIAMAANDRILLKNQTDAKENGIYIWNGAATPATRASDADTFAELESAIVPVEEGTQAGTQWRQTAVNGAIGTDNITFVSFGTTVPDATTSLKGIVRLATQAEVDAGTDANAVVTPATLTAWANGPRRYGAVFGDNSATSYTITHNLNTRDVQVSVYRNVAPYDEVGIDVEKTTVNSITVKSSAAIATNALRAALSY